jgi:seryl-tRNA synthetase
MTSLGLVDWDGPRRFAGGRSYALVGDGALLELSIIRLAVDELIARGMTLVVPPVMVRERAMTGTGYFPLGREEAYSIPADELFLVGTSEVALVSLHCDETLELQSLPRSYAGISPCFRREAGAHGKDTRGLYRVHQFTKVEQVILCAPDEAVAERHHYELLGNAEAILAKLEIPYRVRSVSVKRASTKSSRGCRAETRTARPTLARRSATSNRVARTSACAWPTVRSRTLSR